MYLRVVD